MDSEIEELTIDDEFKDLMHPSSLDEYNNLKESILKEGVRDRIVVWKTDGEKLILDGHNRYEICQEHKIPFKTKKLKLKNRYEAIDWICKNQLGRRNSSPAQKQYLIHKMYENEKKSHGGDRKSDKIKSSQWPLEKTAEKIAEETNVSASTVKRAHQYGKAVDKVHESGLDRDEILSGEVDASQKDIVELATLDVNEIKEIIEKSEDENKKIKDVYKEMKIKEPISKPAEISKKVKKSPPHIHKMEYDEWVKTLDDKSIDLLITQPPVKKEENKKEFIEEWIPLTFSKIKDTGSAFIFVSPNHIDLKVYLDVLTDSNCGLDFVDIIAWTFKDTSEPIPKHAKELTWQPILYLRGKNSKKKGIPTIDRQSSVPQIEIPEDSKINRMYKFQKPNKLIKQLIQFSTKKGDSIIDPFAGAGKFLITGVELECKTSGCEDNDVILKVAKNNGCKII